MYRYVYIYRDTDIQFSLVHVAFQFDKSLVIAFMLIITTKDLASVFQNFQFSFLAIWLLETRCGKVTFCGQEIVNESDVCHFW